MKKGLLILLLLTACGGAVDDNHGYGWHYDEIGGSGLRVRFDDNARKLVEFEEIEQWYLDVQECTGIKANGPLVIFVPEKIGDGIGGWWFWNSDTIIIWSAEHALFFPTRGSSTKHEFIHYLLNENGYPFKRNDSHDSYLWAQCSF